MHKLSRRDFLKLSAALSAAATVSGIAPSLVSSEHSQSDPLPNVIILVLDTMSARNLSVYDYPRKTTPNFEKFASRATVYHSHHSGGNFTVPGTASLLSGLYPWTHRAINQSGFIARKFMERNFFRFFGNAYTKLAFSQNLWATHLLGQFSADIDAILSPALFAEVAQVIGDKSINDANASYLSFDEFLFDSRNPPASLVLGVPERALLSYKANHSQDYGRDYPLGLPTSGLLPIYFRLDKVFDGLMSIISRLSSPYLAYFHLWGVHGPYKPHEDFFNIFKDGWQPEPKPRHRLGGKNSYEKLLKMRERYDEYIASVDSELGRLIDFLDQKGALDNNYLIVTADHGESLERGTLGHTTPLLFEPLIHVPLLISAPGQRNRIDIYSPTNSVDILPTLLSIAGQEIPDWCEGYPLPIPGSSADPQRSTFSLEAKNNPAFGPLTKATVAMRKGKYKMIFYTGHEEYDFFELYDLEGDPEELNDLYAALPSVANPMQEELLAKFEYINRPYQKT